MEGFDESDEPFIYRLNDNGTGPSLLVKVTSTYLYKVLIDKYSYLTSSLMGKSM